MSPALTRCLSAAASGFLKEFARAESITDGQGVRESATFELQTGAPARSHVACLHNYQLSRSAWRASPSMTNTSPCVPSMPPSPFARLARRCGASGRLRGAHRGRLAVRHQRPTRRRLVRGDALSFWSAVFACAYLRFETRTLMCSVFLSDERYAFPVARRAPGRLSEQT